MTDSALSGAWLLELVAEVIAAYVAHNRVPVGDLPALVDTVYQALQATPTPETAEPAAAALKPAVPVKKSVQGEHIACLECGRTLAMLKRHLRSDHGLAPDEYRAKWNLASDYPMVAPDYAAERSKLALSIGLGRRRATAGT